MRRTSKDGVISFSWEFGWNKVWELGKRETRTSDPRKSRSLENSRKGRTRKVGDDQGPGLC